jgi:hypothetical protein
MNEFCIIFIINSSHAKFVMCFVQKHQDHNLIGQQNPFGNLSMDVNEDNIFET